MCQASLSQCHARVALAKPEQRWTGTILLCRRRDRRAKPDPPTRSPRSTTRCLLLLLFREQPGSGLTDACKYLGVAHSTAHPAARMLATTASSSRSRSRAAYIAGPALVEVGSGRRRLAERSRAGPTCNGGAGAETGRDRPSGALEGTRSVTSTGWNPNALCVWWPGRGTLAPAHCTSLARRCSPK